MLRRQRSIAFNTMLNYARSVVAVFLGLFSSRWVLNGLGTVDFGIFSVVGSIMLFVSFFQAIANAGVLRYYAYAIGQNDEADLRLWFNSALSLMVFSSVLLCVITYPAGYYCVGHVLTIPADRLADAQLIFAFSIIAFIGGMVSVPYIAMLNAHLRFGELAIWGVLQSAATFLLAFAVTFYRGDRLLFYAAGMLLQTLFFFAAQSWRSQRLFPACRIHWPSWCNYKYLRELVSFGGWSFLGNLAAVVRLNGSLLLLNVFWGVKVNAAFSIALNVSNQSSMLTTAMISSLTPVITASEGANDRSRMLNLSLQACKFGTLLVMIFALPLIIEMEYVLKLWLKTPPPYTAQFCQLMLIGLVIDKMTVGQMMAVFAAGRIASYQTVLGILNILCLPAAYACAKLNLSPLAVGWVILVSFILNGAGRLIFARYLLGMSSRQWSRAVLFPCMVLAAIIGLGIYGVRDFMAPSFIRLMAVGISCSVIILPVTYRLLLTAEEKTYVNGIILQCKKKFLTI